MSTNKYEELSITLKDKTLEFDVNDVNDVILMDNNVIFVKLTKQRCIYVNKWEIVNVKNSPLN